MYSLHLNNRKSMQQDVQLDVHSGSNTSTLCCLLLLLYHLTDSRKHYPKYGFCIYDAKHWTGRRKIWLRIIDRTWWAVVHGDCCVTIIIYLHTPSLSNLWNNACCVLLFDFRFEHLKTSTHFQNWNFSSEVETSLSIGRLPSRYTVASMWLQLPIKLTTQLMAHNLGIWMTL